MGLRVAALSFRSLILEHPDATEGNVILLNSGRGDFAPAADVGEWLSLVEHLVRDQGVGGSNPLSPTNFLKQIHSESGLPANRRCSASARKLNKDPAWFSLGLI